MQEDQGRPRARAPKSDAVPANLELFHAVVLHGLPQWMMSFLIAKSAAPARVERLILLSMCCTWCPTVFSAMCRRSAICRFEWCRQISRRTSPDEGLKASSTTLLVERGCERPYAGVRSDSIKCATRAFFRTILAVVAQSFRLIGLLHVIHRLCHYLASDLGA